ncbi:hypothetical protein Q8A73_000686 [Channa argus]|nr:hypothetical protein Q8A73_000686 [Channa argus]
MPVKIHMKNCASKQRARDLEINVTSDGVDMASELNGNVPNTGLRWYEKKAQLAALLVIAEETSNMLDSTWLKELLQIVILTQGRVEVKLLAVSNDEQEKRSNYLGQISEL